MLAFCYSYWYFFLNQSFIVVPFSSLCLTSWSPDDIPGSAFIPLGLDTMQSLIPHLFSFWINKAVSWKTIPVYFWPLTISRDCTYLQMLFKFNHVRTLVDLRLNFSTPITAVHVETGYRSTIGNVRVARCRKFTILKRTSAFIWSKNSQWEREES